MPATISQEDLSTYFTDVVQLLLQVRDETPIEYMANYFRRVLTGEHVVGREYNYISATAWNRRSFVFACHNAFGNAASQELTVRLPGVPS